MPCQGLLALWIGHGVGTPFITEHYQALVDGIAASILHITMCSRTHSHCSGRSGKMAARKRRTCKTPSKSGEDVRDIDTELTMLKFVAGDKPLGVLSWHAVHPRR